MWDTIKLWWQAMIDFFYRLLLTLFDFLKDFFFWILDNVISIAVGFLDLAGEALASLNPLQYISAIPSETQAMMSAIGFNDCMAIIVAALGIRFILQLIPFVRWGS
jgi:hypothetical protein